MDSEEDLSADMGDNQVDDESESMEGLEINVTVISDTLQRLCEKSKRQKLQFQDGNVATKELTYAAKKFIIDNVMYIDYHDLASLVGMRADDLKSVLMDLGIKVPVQGARPWKEIDVGTFTTLEQCAKCQIQAEHGIFAVGINDCRACYEENIRNWAEEGEPIRLSFFNEE
jgi:hypothetical protein